MSNLLFDAPWWLPTLLIGVGVILFWNGNRRQESRVRNVGLAVFLAGIAVITVSYLVDTDLEKAVKETKKLVHDVELRDWADMKRILDPAASLTVLGDQQIYGNRDEIIKGAQRGVDRYGVKNIRVLSTTPEQTDTVITITMTIYSEHEATMGHPITTTWQFMWEQTGKDWTLKTITNLAIGNLTGQQAGRQFPEPK